jgi:TonB-dependent starch-binding outer membrane protein SusC
MQIMQWDYSKTYSLFYRFTTLVLLLFCGITLCAQAATAPGDTKISISVKNITLKEAFTAIYKKTGVWVTYSNEQFNDQKKVSVSVENVTLSALMDQFLKDTGFSYRFVDNTIVIRKNGEEPGAPPVGNVSGKVVDKNGKPIPGVTVQVKGKSKGTSTSPDGSFFLKDVEQRSTLVVSSIGYQTKEVLASAGDAVIVQMKEATGILDETVVIAYGTTTKRFSTSNIGTVKAEDIEKQPVSNPLLALQGRVSGLFISQSSGVSGSGVSVRIQGQNSLLNGNDPLYVIDGVPYTSQLLPNASFTNTILGNSGTSIIFGSPLSYINPSDIESIDVLKDADATAIYGSRAANGAILITTKKGKIGPTRFDINAQTGVGEVAHQLHLLNTKQYLEVRHEAKLNDNAAISPTDYDINGVWDTTRYTNWQKELIGNAAHYTDLQTSLSGGSGNTQFLVNGGYHKETTVFPGAKGDEKGSIHFNLNNTSINQKFKFQLNANYLVDNNRLMQSDYTSAAMALAPDAPALYNKDGSLNWEPKSNGSSTWFNPIASSKNIYRNNTKNLIGSALLSYDIFQDLQLRSNFGYTNLQSEEVAVNSSLSLPPEIRPVAYRTADYAYGTIGSWIIEPQLNYKKTFRESKLDVLLGSTIQQNNNKSNQFEGSGYNSDLVLEDIRSATSIISKSTINSIYKYYALFGRINFTFNDKYILNLNGRRDGSSRFGPENLFHNFGSIGAAWIFSDEPFIRDALQGLSFGKIRASYGTTGNDQIGDYTYLNLYSPIDYQVPYQNGTSLQVNGIYNPYLQWEETRKTQIGVDLGFFKDRIVFNGTYSINRSSNELLPYTLPLFTGAGSVLENFPAKIQNTSIELGANTKNIENKEFTWHTSANITIPDNKLVSFPDLANSSYASTYVIGKSIIMNKVFHLIGVNPQTGVFEFADKDGKATNTPSYGVDNNTLISTAPKFYGGLSNDFTYKGFQLSFFIQFVKQLGLSYRFGSFPGIMSNQPTWVLDRWRKPGDVAENQRFNSDFTWFSQQSYAAASDAAWTDASYIRLKNLSLAWQVPDSWKNRMKLQNVKFYARCQNLFTITKYLGLDPETRSSTTLPPLRTITFGLQISL